MAQQAHQLSHTGNHHFLSLRRQGARLGHPQQHVLRHVTMALRQVAQVDCQQLEGVDELIPGSLFQKGIGNQDVLAEFVAGSIIVGNSHEFEGGVAFLLAPYTLMRAAILLGWPAPGGVRFIPENRFGRSRRGGPLPETWHGGRLSPRPRESFVKMSGVGQILGQIRWPCNRRRCQTTGLIQRHESAATRFACMTLRRVR